MDPREYKLLHESFMANNNGTGTIEVFATITPSFFYPFLTVSLLSALPQQLPVPVRFLCEFVAIVWTVVLDVTVLHSRIYEINGTLLFIVCTIVAKYLFNRTHVLPFVNQIPVKRPEFVACLRATTSLITAVCILAVDFRAFPRKLAKCESYGFALMDTGVGLFVFSNALVDVLGKADRLTRPLTGDRMKTLLKNTYVLFALGAIRLYFVKEIDYQEHTSEYGVHWNFFFTLAVTRIMGTIVLSFLPSLSYAKLASICIVVGHQLTLQLGLADWVTNTEVNRDTLLTANREGIVSIPGYVGLYLACIYLGSILVHKTESNNPDSDTAAPSVAASDFCTAHQLSMRALLVAIHALVVGKLAVDCRNSFGVSRRLADMGYVLSIFAIASAMTALFMLLEVFYHVLVFQKARSNLSPADTATHSAPLPIAGDISRYCPMVLSAINYNGMAFFLAANLMTGMVNMAFQTLLVDTAGCVFIVSTYMFVLCAIMTFLYVNEIKLKI